jgi:hypothetical protein
MFKTFAKSLAPSGAPAPALWSDESTVRERFGNNVQACSPRVGITTSTIRFHPPKSWSFSDKYYGPWNRAFSSLDDLATKKLREELETLWSTHNRAGGELTFVAAEYFQVTAVRAQIG